jgi:hypothetical protein
MTNVRAQLGVKQAGSWLALRRRDDVLVSTYYPPGDVVRLAACCGSTAFMCPLVSTKVSWSLVLFWSHNFLRRLLYTTFEAALARFRLFQKERQLLPKQLLEAGWTPRPPPAPGLMMMQQNCQARNKKHQVLKTNILACWPWGQALADKLADVQLISSSTTSRGGNGPHFNLNPTACRPMAKAGCWEARKKD